MAKLIIMFGSTQHNKASKMTDVESEVKMQNKKMKWWDREITLITKSRKTNIAIATAAIGNGLWALLIFWQNYFTLINEHVVSQYAKLTDAQVARIGQFGDSFAALAFILNAASLGFLGYQLKMQREELAIAREDAKEQQKNIIEQNQNIRKQAEALERQAEISKEQIEITKVHTKSAMFQVDALNAANIMALRQLTIQELFYIKQQITLIIDGMKFMSSDGAIHRGHEAIDFIIKNEGKDITRDADYSPIFESCMRIHKLHRSAQQSLKMTITDDDGMLAILPTNYFKFENVVIEDLNKKVAKMGTSLRESRQALYDHREKLPEYTLKENT